MKFKKKESHIKPNQCLCSAYYFKIAIWHSKVFPPYLHIGQHFTFPNVTFIKHFTTIFFKYKTLLPACEYSFEATYFEVYSVFYCILFCNYMYSVVLFIHTVQNIGSRLKKNKNYIQNFHDKCLFSEIKRNVHSVIFRWENCFKMIKIKGCLSQCKDMQHTHVYHHVLDIMCINAL